jgi:nitrogen PTS system EIIA component
MTLSEHFSSNQIKFLETRNKLLAIEELAYSFEESSICENISSLVKTLKEREEMMSTGIGFGIAIPHAKIHQVKKLSFAVGISSHGIDFDSMDGTLVNLIILVIASDNQSTEYLGLLSTIMNMLRIDGVKDSILSADSAETVYNIFQNNLAT